MRALSARTWRGMPEARAALWKKFYCENADREIPPKAGDYFDWYFALELAARPKSPEQYMQRYPTAVAFNT